RAALESEPVDAEDAGRGREHDAHPDRFVAADVIDGEIDDARRPAAVAEGGDFQRIAHRAAVGGAALRVGAAPENAPGRGRRVVEVEVEVGLRAGAERAGERLVPLEHGADVAVRGNGDRGVGQAGAEVVQVDAGGRIRL